MPGLDEHPPFLLLRSASGQPVGREAELWRTTASLKNEVLKLLGSSNDGVKTLAIKFLQKLILVHSPGPDGETASEHDVSLESIADGNLILNRQALEDEGRVFFQSFLQLFTMNLSASILTALISVCVPLVKQRPAMAAEVISAMVRIHQSPPSGLTPQQAKTVQHTLKLQLGILRKQPEAAPHLGLFKDTLDALSGKPEAEKRKAEGADPRRKRLKRDDEDFETIDTPPTEPPADFDLGQVPPPPPANTLSFDILQLAFPMVVDIVLQSLPNLPYEMPLSFPQACEGAKNSLGIRFATEPFKLPNMSLRYHHGPVNIYPEPGGYSAGYLAQPYQQPPPLMPGVLPPPQIQPLPLSAAVPAPAAAPPPSRDPRVRDPRVKDPRMRNRPEADAPPPMAAPPVETYHNFSTIMQPPPIALPYNPQPQEGLYMGPPAQEVPPRGAYPQATPTPTLPPPPSGQSNFPVIHKAEAKKFELRAPSNFTPENALAMAKYVSFSSFSHNSTPFDRKNEKISINQSMKIIGWPLTGCCRPGT